MRHILSQAILLALFSATPAVHAYNTIPTPVPGPGETSSGQFSFSASVYYARESDGQVSVVVTRSGGASGAITVGYRTSDGSARAGEDYTAVQGGLSWADGESGAKSFTVSISNDNRVEGDETVLLSLFNGNAQTAAPVPSLGVFEATLVIQDDDQRGTADLLTSVAENPTQLAIAQTIAQVYDNGTASADLYHEFDALVQNAAHNPHAVAEALQAIAPEEYLSQGRLSLESVSTQTRNINSRLYALRQGRRCIDVSGADLKHNGQVISGSALFTPDALCPDAHQNPSANKLGVFVNGTFDSGERDHSNRESGFEFDTQGVTAGVDYRLSDTAIVGAALGYMKTSANLDRNAGGIDADGYSVSVYGTLYETDKFYLDAIYSYGSTGFDNQRFINYSLPGSSVNQVASASNDGTQHAFSLGLGHHYRYGRLLHSPNVNLDYTKINLDSLSESVSAPGASGASLGMHVSEQEVESLRMRLGWQVSYEAKLGWGSLMPHASLHAIYDFKNDSRYLQGYFLQDAARTGFAIGNDSPDRAYLNLGLGLMAEFAPGKMAYLSYETPLENRDMSYHALSAGVRLPF